MRDDLDCCEVVKKEEGVAASLHLHTRAKSSGSGASDPGISGLTGLGQSGKNVAFQDICVRSCHFDKPALHSG